MKIKFSFFILIFSFFMIYNYNCYADVTPQFIDNKETSDINLGTDDQTCSALGSFKDDLQSIFNAFKIVAPILTLVLSTFDYVTTILGKEMENMKKTNQRFLTRLILVVVLYFIPVLLNVLMNIIFPGSGTCIR